MIMWCYSTEIQLWLVVHTSWLILFHVVLHIFSKWSAHRSQNWVQSLTDKCDKSRRLKYRVSTNLALIWIANLFFLLIFQGLIFCILICDICGFVMYVFIYFIISLHHLYIDSILYILSRNIAHTALKQTPKIW